MKLVEENVGIGMRKGSLGMEREGNLGNVECRVKEGEKTCANLDLDL